MSVATLGSTKLLADVTEVAMKTAEGGVVLTGATVDTSLAIGTGAVKAVGDVGVAATGAVGSVGSTALTEAAKVGVTTLEGTGKTLRAAEDAVFNTSTRVLKGVDAMTRIAASAGANTAARIETSQAATATGIAARAPEKIRRELLGVFDTQVTKDMQELLRIAGKTQLANLELQIGAFKNVYCYGLTGFFKKYFSTHPCPRQRPPNTADGDLQQMKLFAQQLDGKLKMLATSVRTKLGSSGNASDAYAAIVEEFRAGAAKLADELAAKYAPIIQKYITLNDKFFNPETAPAPVPEAQPAVGQGRQTRRAGRRRARRGNRPAGPPPPPPPPPPVQPAAVGQGRRYTRRPKKASKGPDRFFRRSF